MMPLVQAPVFLSFFFGIRKMAELPVTSLQTGGALWFTDLTVPDPLYLLPAMTATTFLVTIELGTDGVNPQQKGTIKFLFRAMAVGMIPLTATFPSVLSSPFLFLFASAFSSNQVLLRECWSTGLRPTSFPSPSTWFSRYRG